MRNFRFFALAVVFCAAMPVLGAPEAAPSTTAAPSPSSEVAPAVKTRPFPFRSVVVSVDPAARTFRMGKKIIHQVHILPDTRVMKGDGTPGVFEALAPGVEVRGSVRKRADGEYMAVSVWIGPKPDAAPGLK